MIRIPSLLPLRIVLPGVLAASALAAAPGPAALAVIVAIASAAVVARHRPLSSFLRPAPVAARVRNRIR